MCSKIFYICFFSLTIFVLSSLYIHFKVNKGFYNNFIKFDIVKDYKQYKDSKSTNNKKPYLVYLANVSLTVFIISLLTLLLCKICWKQP